MRIEALDAAIKAVCPIDGIDSAGGISFKASATDEERSAARAIMDAELPTLDLSPPVFVAPTKEELIAQIQALAAKVEALP